jgi:hypothetical protein
LETKTAYESGSIKVTSATATKAGDIIISSGDSMEGNIKGSSVFIKSGASYLVGGDLLLSGGDSKIGGDVIISGGIGVINEGKVLLKSSSGNQAIQISDEGLSLSSKSVGSKISLTVPLINNVSASTNVIEFGYSKNDEKTTKIDFRLQTTQNKYGKDTSLIVSSAPLQVTLIQYSSDERVKTEIESVDEDSILQRINSISVRSYRYTKEWLSVRDDLSDVRVRGLIAQELAEVFPEYVSVIPEFTLADKQFSIKDFHQVDKTSIIIDLIAAIQAQSRRFSITANTKIKTGNITLKSSSWADVFNGSDEMSSGDVSVSTGNSEGGTTGAIVLKTGNSSLSSAGKILLAVGVSGSGDGSELRFTGGSTLDTSGVGGSLLFFSGNSLLKSGDISLVTASNSLSTGNILLSTGNSDKFNSGSVNVRAGNGFISDGGSVEISGGNSFEKGGVLKIQSGMGSTGGDLLIRSGDGSTKEGGDVNILAGVGTFEGGSVTIESGSTQFGIGGLFVLSGGGASTAGEASLFAGSSINDLGASVIISGGSSFVDSSGSVVINSFSSSLSSGDVVLTTGSSKFRSSGIVSISTGSSDFSGSIILSTGYSSTQGGSLSLYTGSGENGGSIDISTGFSTNEARKNSTGSLTLIGSSEVLLKSSSSFLSITTGTSFSDSSGSIYINTGDNL